MTTTFKLYSTSACHLCEAAAAILEALPAVGWETVEISESDALIARYGTRIPVLQHTGTGLELNWPFTEGEIHALLKATD